nr:hypothetical protein [Tanacetum cinerariifolium]
MEEHNNSSRYNDNKGKRKHQDTRANPNKKPRVTCWKCGKPGHLKKDCKDDDVAWWVDSGATMHVCKDRCWFKIYESLNNGSIFHMGNESTARVHERGCVDLRLGHVHFKRMQDMYKDGLIPAIDMDTEKYKTCMLNKITKKPFQNVKSKTKVLELIHSGLYDLHATPSLENKKYFVTFIDDPSRLSQGFWDEAMLTACYLLNRVHNKRNMTTPYELWTKKKPNLNYLRVWGCRETLRLHDPKLKTLVAINSTIESRDASFDEQRFSSVPKPSQRSLDVAFWKEAINDEMDSIMGNNTWVLTDLPPGYKSLGCKWIFKRKLKVDGTVKKYKARLVIQGFKL